MSRFCQRHQYKSFTQSVSSSCSQSPIQSHSEWFTRHSLGLCLQLVRLAFSHITRCNFLHAVENDLIMKRKLSAHTLSHTHTLCLCLALSLSHSVCLWLSLERGQQLFRPLSLHLHLGLHLSAKHPFPLFANVVTLPLFQFLFLSLIWCDMWLCVCLCIFQIVLHFATVAEQTDKQTDIPSCNQ